MTSSPPPQDTDRERKLQNIRVGKICCVAERFGNLSFQSCNFEPRHRGHKMCPRCVALGCFLGERGIGYNWNIWIFFEVFGQVGKCGATLHLNRPTINEKIESWGITCLGEADIVAVCDQLIHHEALSCVSPQRPTGTGD
ncbi:hypothetical protein [Yoonia vestfoldensis]|uniref:hypothetical protein n=1 Tax=Yoonia vestfoldensis TaxID=245188 RepID=UPI0003662B20|nr:hypothetical protein [Yoonia vestfoldensis]